MGWPAGPIRTRASARRDEGQGGDRAAAITANGHRTKADACDEGPTRSTDASGDLTVTAGAQVECW